MIAHLAFVHRCNLSTLLNSQTTSAVAREFVEYNSIRSDRYERIACMPIKLLVDTDIGVDDAIAIAWLLRQPEAQIIGLTTVAGNTSLANASMNLLTLLQTAGVTLPITTGAALPLNGTAPRTASLVHGPDGFWGVQMLCDWQALPTDAPAAIARAAREHADLVLVALGPLTNFALAVQRFPDDLAGRRLVALGGARHGGNTSPVAEFNIFADPEALAVVLHSRLRTELLLLDAFDTLHVQPDTFLPALATHGGAVGRLLARSLQPYFAAMSRYDTGSPSLPDPAALIYVLHPELAEVVPAYVHVVTQPGVTWGQTVIALNAFEKARMLNSPEVFNQKVDAGMAAGQELSAAIEAILADVPPDNALVIPSIDAARMAAILEAGLWNTTHR